VPVKIFILKTEKLKYVCMPKHHVLKAYKVSVIKPHTFLASAWPDDRWSASQSVHFTSKKRTIDTHGIWVRQAPEFV
jgi:hypothetical protein